jgi:hypothetical protein
MIPQFPKVYHQMKAMLRICKKNRAKANDKSYVDALIEELEFQCEVLEAVAAEEEEEFNGELEELNLEIPDHEISQDDDSDEDFMSKEEAA